MTNFKIYKYKNGILFVALSILFSNCNVPKATIIKGKISENIHSNFLQHTEIDTEKNHEIITWKQFFTDSNLTNLINIALNNNQDLLIVLQEINISKADVLLKKGKIMPSFTARTGSGFEKVGRYTSTGAGDASTDMTPGKKVPDILGEFSGGFMAVWEADIWKKLRNEKESAISHYLATIEGKNFVLSNLIAEIANNYYELLSLDNQLDIIQQYIKLQNKALEISKVQKQAAAATELAVKKFEAELVKSKASEFELQQEITEKENQINLLLGRYPQPIIRSKEAFMNTKPLSISNGIPSQLLNNRPDIKQAELELKATKLDVEVARKEFYPSLDITASLGLEAFKPTFLAKLPESIAFGLAGDLVGPIINKSAIKANFQAANARQIQAMYEYEKRILGAFIEVVNLMTKEKNINEYYQLKSQEVAHLEQAIDIANILFKNSRADYLEVLLNQRDALDAKLDLISTKEKQLTTIVNLYKSLGGGWQ